jgi:hypothetical protein
MMKNLSSVKSIALGGRPSTVKIQAIGGTKGAQSLSFAGVASNTPFFLDPTISPEVTATQKTILFQLSDLPMNRSLDNGVNFSDRVLQSNVNDGLPAQFVREDADCRIFYTPAMMQNVTAMWEAAADAAFNGKACVVGGTHGAVITRAVPEPKERIAMAKAADDARSYLEQVRMKAIMEPVERMAGWEELHGKAVPNMYMA